MSISAGPALGTKKDPRYAFVHATIYKEPDKDDGKQVSWSLRALHQPAGDPPEGIAKRNEKVGGAAGLRALLASTLGTDLPVGEVLADFQLPADKWRCVSLPSPGVAATEPPGAVDLAGTTFLEQVGYRFIGGAEGIEELVVMYMHATKEYLVRAQIRSGVRFDGDVWFPAVITARDLIIAKLFVRGGGE